MKKITFLLFVLVLISTTITAQESCEEILDQVEVIQDSIEAKADVQSRAIQIASGNNIVIDALFASINRREMTEKEVLVQLGSLLEYTSLIRDRHQELKSLNQKASLLVSSINYRKCKRKDKKKVIKKQLAWDKDYINTEVELDNLIDFYYLEVEANIESIKEYLMRSKKVTRL